MKYILILIAICGLCAHSHAASLYHQLCTFNPNWNNYPMQIPAALDEIPVTEQEYVQLHLSCVIPVLRTNTTNGLSDEQLNRRFELIEILDNYRMAGNFPLNEETNYRTPVFIDRYNTYCAVGYLMRASGYDGLARSIAADNNLAWVKDIRVDGVAQWQQFSGFTLNELKLIQGAYDTYRPLAYLLPNRYEVPQKPEVVVRYFDEDYRYSPDKSSAANYTVWCKGEGQNGVLHGKWIQNYSKDFPWIEGYYAHGRRTGQWKEYYPGTNLLCRTENWRDDKLNGVRKRYDREGKLIEEIMFRDGLAAVKTNYDFVDSVYHVRQLIDSAHVSTEVFTLEGRLLAAGAERVYNPSNLKWFQNIELTMLNTLMINTPTQPTHSSDNFGELMLHQPFSPALVEYIKEGTWVYYQEGANHSTTTLGVLLSDAVKTEYAHCAAHLNDKLELCRDIVVNDMLDSLEADYLDGKLVRLIARGPQDFVQLRLSYFPTGGDSYPVSFNYYGYNPVQKPALCSIARYNKQNERTGTWTYYNPQGLLIRSETYHMPQKEESGGDEHAVLPLGDAWKR